MPSLRDGGSTGELQSPCMPSTRPEIARIILQSMILGGLTRTPGRAGNTSGFQRRTNGFSVVEIYMRYTTFWRKA